MRQDFVEYIEQIEAIDGFYMDDREDCDTVYDKTGEEVEFDCNYEVGASKAVILFEDCVMKVAFRGYYHKAKDGNFLVSMNNYCAREVSFFKAAKKEGVDKFFLKCRMISPEIEIQELGDIYSVPFPVIEDEEEEKRIQKNFSKYANEHMSLRVQSILRDYYNDNELEKFCRFIEKYKINDLVFHNLAMKNGRAVFMDYSGYNEEIDYA